MAQSMRMKLGLGGGIPTALKTDLTTVTIAKATMGMIGSMRRKLRGVRRDSYQVRVMRSMAIRTIEGEGGAMEADTKQGGIQMVRTLDCFSKYEMDVFSRNNGRDKEAHHALMTIS